jgi:hypothetical protein
MGRSGRGRGSQQRCTQTSVGDGVSAAVQLQKWWAPGGDSLFFSGGPSKRAAGRQLGRTGCTVPSPPTHPAPHPPTCSSACCSTRACADAATASACASSTSLVTAARCPVAATVDGSCFGGLGPT